MSDQTIKADGGKLRPSLVIHDMARALLLVTACASYGCQKYAAKSWMTVARERYDDAGLRHMLEPAAGLGEVDTESGLLHEAHEVWNALARLELAVKDLSPDEFRALLAFRGPPTAHKTPEVMADGFQRPSLTEQVEDARLVRKRMPTCR